MASLNKSHFKFGSVPLLVLVLSNLFFLGFAKNEVLAQVSGWDPPVAGQSSVQEPQLPFPEPTTDDGHHGLHHHHSPDLKNGPYDPRFLDSKPYQQP
jgi:hypothetical protein